MVGVRWREMPRQEERDWIPGGTLGRTVSDFTVRAGEPLGSWIGADLPPRRITLVAM